MPFRNPLLLVFLLTFLLSLSCSLSWESRLIFVCWSYYVSFSHVSRSFTFLLLPVFSRIFRYSSYHVSSISRLFIECFIFSPLYSVSLTLDLFLTLSRLFLSLSLSRSLTSYFCECRKWLCSASCRLISMMAAFLYADSALPSSAEPRVRSQ